VLTAVKPAKNGDAVPAEVATAETLPAVVGVEELLLPPQLASTIATTAANVKIDVLGTWVRLLFAA
jgi:hypothetical protein